jgi:geranylgeranylglycerol-phosphate geranylgeranyltransferase
VPVVLVIGTTAAFAVLATSGSPPATTTANLLLAMLGAQIAIGTVNDLVDAETDALVKPAKPIPAGLVSVRGARTIVAGSLLVMVWFSARMGPASLGLCTFGTAVGIAYSLWFKRTRFAWFPYLVALPLLPIWVVTAVAAFDARLLLLYPLGVPAAVSVYLSQSLPDVVADRASCIRNLSSLLGERRAFLVILASIGLSMIAAPVAAWIWTESPDVVVAASGLAAVLVLTSAAVYGWRRRVGVMVCFPCVALATAILGLGWVLAVTK